MKYLLTLAAAMCVSGCYTYYPVEVRELSCDTDSGVVENSDLCRAEREAGEGDAHVH